MARKLSLMLAALACCACLAGCANNAPNPAPAQTPEAMTAPTATKEPAQNNALLDVPQADE